MSQGPVASRRCAPAWPKNVLRITYFSAIAFSLLILGTAEGFGLIGEYDHDA